MPDWSSAREIGDLKTADIAAPGVVFRVGDDLLRTTGETVGTGGMGSAYRLELRRDGGPEAQVAVGKVFRWEYLIQISRDPETKRHYAHNLEVLSLIQRIRELHLLPILVSHPLKDNHLVVTPLGGDSLVTLVNQGEISARDKVLLLAQAIRGLRALHDRDIVHGDFTLRNILVNRGPKAEHIAMLFDFDLSLALDLLPDLTYAQHYEGRIVGSPELSLSPEQVDSTLDKLPLSFKRDIYAVGTALYALFSEQSVYGETADLPTLLETIGEGVVRKGNSRIRYPDAVPVPIREVINRCLERDPVDRYIDCTELIHAVELASQSLGDRPSRRFSTLGYVQVPRAMARDVFQERPDKAVTLEQIQSARTALARQGYLLERSLGRVKEYPIYLAQPDPVLVASGRFHEANSYRKIVTAIDLRDRPDAEAFIESWLARIMPVLEDVRRQLLTVLYKVMVDRASGQLLLFSEYLDDARFGTDLEGKNLSLEEVLALGFIISNQVERLHGHGLSHGNVALASLLFKRLQDSGHVRALLVGLVDPSFQPEALADDVRRLAALVLLLIRPGHVSEAPPDKRPGLADLMRRLETIAHASPPITKCRGLIKLLGDGLALVDRNFDVLRRHGGDPLRFAELLTRHSLYRHLWR